MYYVHEHDFVTLSECKYMYGKRYVTSKWMYKFSLFYVIELLNFYEKKSVGFFK